MEVQVYIPSQGQPLPSVQWNYAEVKQWLIDGLESYKNRVYTKENMVLAKKDRATLNKLDKVLDDKRKEVKAEYMKNISEFEAQIKELRALISEMADPIDAQIKAEEETRKQEKQEKIKEMYTAMIGNLADLVPYDRLHDPKWLNVSTTMNTVTEQLGGKIDRIEAGLSSIDKLSLAPDIAEQVKGVFLKSYDLAAALAEKERIEKQRDALAKYNAKQQAFKEELARRQAEQEQQPKVIDASDPDAFKKAQPGDVVRFGGPGCVTPEPAPVTAPAPAPDEPLYTVAFKVEATATQLNALKEFLKSNNIRYGRA